MTRAVAKIAAVVIAAALTAAGIAGAYRYGRDYYLHRGFSTLVNFRRAGTGRLESVQFYSSALHRNADYLVYLPPQYNPHRRYPVFYMLHGMPGQPRVFVDIANMDVRLDNQLSLRHVQPMILVYPDGRIGGSVLSDSEWANTPSGAFENYVVDVMRNVDQHFATIRRRQDRVLAGFSSGAYGAINIALHHLADFADVQTWSGYFTQTRTGPFAAASRANLAYNSPLVQVRRLTHVLRSYPLRVYMFVGRDDGASHQQIPMVRALEGAGASVKFSFYPGGHDWSVWYPRLNEMLDMASRDVIHPPALVRDAALTQVKQPPDSHVTSDARRHHSELLLVGALLLALISAALINLGFVLQHRGHVRARARGGSSLATGFREPTWLAGQAVGWTGFAGQVVAVALAPLTLVQACSAGSLAISVPLAARVFGHRVRAPQLAAIAIIAVSLVSLPIGFGRGHAHLHAGILIAFALLITLLAARLAPRAGTAALAVAAGAFYGAADAAIKAASIGIRFHGSGVLTGWTLLAGLCTLGGFLAFQAALRGGDSVQPVTLMNAFTALAAAVLGVAAFGERLGSSPAAGLLHGIAIVLVLACVRPLAGAQQRLVGPAPPPCAGPHPRGGARPAASGLRTPRLGRLRLLPTKDAWSVVAGAVLGVVGLVLCSLTALGLLYVLRQLHWLGFGPRVPDALPLLQLAGFAAQPLARLLPATVLAGLVLGVVLIRVDRRRRVVLVGVPALLLFLSGSDASYALARNLGLDQVLLNRSPGLGPWLEGLIFVAASAIPGSARSLRLAAIAPPPRDRWALAPLFAAGIALAVGAALAVQSGHANAQLPRALTSASASNAQISPPTPAARLWPPAPTALSSPPAPMDGGRLLTIHFYSRALHRLSDYLVYLPRNYDPARRLPVFFLLHGMPGRPLAFTVNAHIEAKLEQLILRHRLSPMILVFPDGRIGGNTSTDSEWANTRWGAYESYVVDVVHDVDHRFATILNRRDRAIAGLSAGAYGAANVGLHQIALFGLIQVWSGYFVQTRTGVFARSNRVQLAYNSPLDYVRKIKHALSRDPVRAFLYVGLHDSDRGQLKPMAAALTAAGAKVSYAVYAGGHSWSLWSPRIDQMLIMASRDFARAPRLQP